MNRLSIMAGILLLVVALLAMGGAGASAPSIVRPWKPPQPPFPIPTEQVRQVRMIDFAFRPSVVQVARGTPINLELVNTGSVSHILVIPVLGVSRAVAPGERQIVRLGVVDAGVYEFFCAIPEHRHAGMIGRLIVGPGILAR